MKRHNVIDNLDKEFIVYKSDMLELVNAHTDKMMSKLSAEIRNVEAKFSAEIRHVENRLESRIDRLEVKFDKLLYGIVFAIVVPITMQLVLFFLK